MVGCLVLSHGAIAQALIEASKSIVGECEQVFTLTGPELSVRQVRDRIAELIHDRDLHEGLFILVSLRGGSYWNAALHIAKEFDKVQLISGINLSLLLSFITKHQKCTFEELGQVMLEDGRRAITLVDNPLNKPCEG